MEATMRGTEALALSAVLTWIMIMTAALLRSKLWTFSGWLQAFGNRENPPEPTPVAGRAERAAKNMLENMVLFTALFFAAKSTAKNDDIITLSEYAETFFWARLWYWIVYLLGIPYVRTAIWAVGVWAMFNIAMIAL
jgi:uncharacterized MAPEG superfamily protein